MFKKLNTVALLGILAALVLVYLAFNFFDRDTRSKGFKTELVTIDTTKIDKILISKGDERLELKKEGGNWKVNIGESKYKNATSSSIGQLIGNLETIKPSRIVARNEDKWKDYQVDSLGTRVQVFEDGKSSVDLVIGRLQFVDQRKYFTYVRLFNEKDTYVADNFLAMSINTSSDNFRDGKVLGIKKDSIQQVSFQYADSSFVLTNRGDRWFIDGNRTDSTATAKYLGGLNRVNSAGFYDEELPSRTPDYEVIITENNGSTTELKGWKTGEESVIVSSSSNADNAFDDQGVADKVFKGKSHFIPND